jgi:F-type H+-transporting ATPase subunit b
MEELIKTFHIEAGLLIAQFVNFLIVLGVLYMFAYKPILKALNERTKKIEKGLHDAESAKKKLEEMTEKEKEVLVNAKKEAQEIMQRAEEEAKKNLEIMTNETKEKIEKMKRDAQSLIMQERTKMVSEAKAEIADLIVTATEKIIAEKLDTQKDKGLIEQAIRQ